MLQYHIIVEPRVLYACVAVCMMTHMGRGVVIMQESKHNVHGVPVCTFLLCDCPWWSLLLISAVQGQNV